MISKVGYDDTQFLALVEMRYASFWTLA